MSEPAIDDANDYEAIEAAVSETPRGRWFLAEFARRHRAAETDRLIETIERLFATAGEARKAALSEHVERDLEDMRRSIEEAQRDIAAVKPRGDLNVRQGAANDPDAIAMAAERATLDMLAAVERLHEISDDLRQRNADGDLCDEIETHARGIFMACSFQDMTGQRTARLVTALRYLERRIEAMLVSIQSVAGPRAAD